MKIPFTIKEWFKDKTVPVVNSNGEPVVICEEPVFLQEDGVMTVIYKYATYGHSFQPLCNESDLYFVKDELPLTPFHYCMLRYLNDTCNAKDDDEIIQYTIKYAEELKQLKDGSN